MERYKQKENEDTIPYLLRLAEIKIEEKPDDLDWSDIAEYCNFNCHYDSLRKALQPKGYGAYEIYKYLKDKMVSENVSDDKVLNELEMKKIELQKEKVKIQTLRIELNKLIRQDARFELFLDGIKNSIDTIKVPKFQEFILENGNKVGLLGISDIHFAKKFESVNNSYSRKICYERMNLLLSEVINLIADRDIKYLHIVNGGDNIEGLLRVNSLKVLETGVIDSVIEFSKMMTEWLNQLSNYIPLTYHHVISSNHSEVRFLDTKAGQFPDEDLEKVIIHMIAGSLRDNNRINIPIYTTDYAYFNINNKNIFVCHGHQFKGKKIADIVKELQILHRINIDLLVLGHFHHENILTVGENQNGNIKVILLPSIMGSDPFSDTLLTGSCSGATLIEISNKKGLTTTEVILN